jgi:hypothetical protein
MYGVASRAIFAKPKQELTGQGVVVITPHAQRLRLDGLLLSVGRFTVQRLIKTGLLLLGWNPRDSSKSL